MKREQIKQPSIRERKLKEMLENDEKKIDDELKDKFKAKPVPPEVKIPMYEHIMKEQEERRLKLKEHFEAITKSLEKPFSFYYRDMAKPEIKQEEYKINVFHADPVPWQSKVLLCEKLAKQEELRKDRIIKIAKESLSHSKLPPRMEAAAKAKQQSKTPKYQTEKIKPFKAKEVPDFKILQEAFQESLSVHKQGYIPTTPQPFNFSQSQRSQESLKLLDFHAQALQQWAIKAKKRSSSAFAKPKITPGITQKTKDMMMIKQQNLLKSQETIKARLAQEDIRKLKHDTMKRLMKKYAVIGRFKHDEEQQERVKAKKEEIRRNEIEYKVKLQEIREKVAQRPLLLEQMTTNSISKGFEAMEPVKRLMNQEYISEALTSQEEEGSNESFG